jgi:valyl-tRNA synthetase
VLEASLRLAHPFAPFVTETIWQTLGWRQGLLMKERLSAPLSYDDVAAGEFERLQMLVAEVRFVTAELPKKGGHTLLYGQDSLIADNRELVRHLARLHAVEATDQPRGLRLAVSGREAWLDIDEKTLEKHKGALEERLKETRQRVEILEARLSNETYVSKAPVALVDESREQLAAQKALITRLEAELAVIS